MQVVLFSCLFSGHLQLSFVSTEPKCCRSRMDGSQKRVFSVAFGMMNNILETFRKRERLRGAEDEEFMLIVSQFTTM